MYIERLFIGTVVLGMLSFLTACDRDYTPKRLSDIPESAVWAGGPDGGAWIECQVASDGKSNPCKVWSDQTGRLEAQGEFHLEREQRAAAKEELRFTGYGGTQIYLADNRVLVPLPGTDPLIKPQ